jgi:hypothetical protein
VFLALAFVVPNIGYRHPRLGFMCLSLALVFGVWAALSALEARSRVANRLLVQPLALMGRVALMLYAFHHLIGYRLPQALGWEHSRSEGLYGIFEPSAALAGLLLMIALCYAASGVWLRSRDRVQAQTLGRLPGFDDLREAPTPSQA